MAADLNELLIGQKMSEALRQRDFEDDFRTLKRAVDSLKSENQFLNKKLSEKDEEQERQRQIAKEERQQEEQRRIQEDKAKKMQNLENVVNITRTIKEKKDSLIDCPTCHIHKIKKVSPLEIKCEGPDCDTKFFLFPKKVDYECESCGLPMSKEIMLKNNIENCPRCGSKKAKLIRR